MDTLGTITQLSSTRDLPGFTCYEVQLTDNVSNMSTCSLNWTETQCRPSKISHVIAEGIEHEDVSDDDDGEMKENLDKENEDKNMVGTKLSPEDQSKKQSQIASTLKWLAENYERAEGVCLPRCVLYTHYLDFCKKNKFSPSGAATFGKVIRQRFPKLTTRRLGTRGQSKYHYYGIGIKETSIYYHSVYSGRGLTRFSGTKIKTEGTSRKYSLSSKTGTLLPEFPDANNLKLPDSVSCEKAETFIMMYRTHCQRILDTIINANFDEVQNFLLHFWQGMPDHLTSLLSCDVIVDIVGLCDTILYKVMVDVLIPSTIQDLPDTLSAEIKVFAKRIPEWLSSSLEEAPKRLSDKKMAVVKTFIQSLKRQTSFVHLAQTARSVLLSHENVNQMAKDLNEVDFRSIWTQGVICSPELFNNDSQNAREFINEFESLLNKQAPLEAYTEWIDSLIDRCVLETTKENAKPFRERARQFLLHWSFFTSRVMRDLTLRSAPSFGSFHLIHMMFDEYVFLVMETQQNQFDETSMQKNVKKYMKTAGEINTKAKVRSAPSKGDSGGSKAKKRRLDSENAEDGDQSIIPSPLLGSSIKSKDFLEISCSNNTAFTRPQPHSATYGSDFHTDINYPDFTTPSGYHHALTGSTQGYFNSPLKHYSPVTGLNGCSTYDRTTTAAYISHMNSTASYSDPFRNSYNSPLESSQLVPTTVHYNTGINIPPSPSFHSQSSFWADNRISSCMGYNDSYGSYQGGSIGMGGSYGMNSGFGKRNGVFPSSPLPTPGHNSFDDSTGRSAFEATRTIIIIQDP
uniref:DNA-binding protein RFX6-like n=1 Tax=Saccoglossus kowalevskii TaxID=10224 RepID=A0ABM0MNM4_SACKO|nr:PREDICTED: DNA-binding protein RFX6-like [Saccoglossus kowalevskii]